ncbi:hypothetical protein EGN72_01035, partial [Pseudorhodobacter sp. E13]|uniref:YadA-like family protein n=1 Tax=Pseudorhodobacter sp. E13 TaxID=2487931 RepID=UPI000FAECE3B
NSTLAVAGDATFNSDVGISGDTTMSGNLGVSGNSLFQGTVDITDDLNVTIGDASATGTGPFTQLDVNGSGMNLVVDDRAGNSSQVEVTATSVSLTQNGSGFSSSGGTTRLTGTTSTVVSGGSTQMVLSDSGVNFSGAGGAPVRLSGVADGVAPTDAVNVRQLGALEGKLSGAIAGTMAMTQLPTITANESFSFGVAVGGYNGQSAFALGGTARLDNNMVLRGAAQYSKEGGVGAAVGIGWSW